MTLQSSGQISLQQIAQEFGDSAPHSVSEFFNEDVGIPSSGTTTFSTFYDKRDTVELTISTNQSELNLHTYAVSQGWTNGKHLKVTIPSGVYIYSPNESGVALTCCPSGEQGYEAGTRVDIINNGNIIGGYGEGGAAANGEPASGATSAQTGNDGTNGGDAILVSPSGNDITMDLTITNNGTIAGGGGGGASGGGGTKDVVLASQLSFYGSQGQMANFVKVIGASYYSSASAANSANPYTSLWTLDNGNHGTVQVMSWAQTTWSITPPQTTGPTENALYSYNSSYTGEYWGYGDYQYSQTPGSYNSFTGSTTYQRQDFYKIRRGTMYAGGNSGSGGRGSYYNGSIIVSAQSSGASGGSGTYAAGNSGNGGILGGPGGNGSSSAAGTSGGGGGQAGHYYKKNASTNAGGSFTFVNNGTASGLFA